MNETQPDQFKRSTNVLATSVAFTSLIGVEDVVRDNLKISHNSLYSHNVWDKSKEYPDLDPSSVILRFSRLVFDDGTDITAPSKSHYLRPVKEYIYSMLFDPPSYPPKWSTICALFHKGVSKLVVWMDRNGFYKFSDLGPSDVATFLEEMASVPTPKGTSITNRTLRSRLIGLNWLYEQSPKLEDGLSCDPFIDYGSISQWSNKCSEVNVPRRENRTAEMPDSVAKELFNLALEDLTIADTLEKIAEARAVYKPIYKTSAYKKIALNPFPWDLFGLDSPFQVKELETRLIAASYIVIGMLTGMRWHEICAIKSERSNNWIERTIIHEGLERKFFFVKSSTKKLQNSPTAYTWQTVPIVRTALEAAEKGLARRRKTGTFLFPSGQNVGRRQSDTAIGDILRRFVKLHNVRYENSLWPLATHQFRKKFARIMTKKGLSIRALQDQLKHFDIEMTRGYGDMNLYLELQHEKFCVSSEQYEELLAHQSIVIGGGADEIRQYQKQFLGMTRDDRVAFLQELPKAALIEQMDDGLCMYRSAKALCGGDRAACRPADCNNSIIPAAGKRRTYAWRNHENHRLLEFFKGEPLKVAYLQSRLAELAKLLAQLDRAEKGLE
ncbi:tyrosine-type recombinase/integrase [Pseudomonas helleri]|nr:tyrosine-type recombinase/integrase [Pseudomonas helleri]